MRTKHFKAGFLLPLLILTTVSSADASGKLKHIINLAGKQRMLTQKMSKESLMVVLDIDKGATLASLKKTRDLFERTLTGLQKGDEGLGLPVNVYANTRDKLTKVETLWKEFEKTVSAIIASGSATSGQISRIAGANLPLLKNMNKAVKAFESQAEKSESTHGLASTINLAGRQRMFTQKMSKEFLLIKFGHSTDENRANLKKTMRLFEHTLHGLIAGDNKSGLISPPNKDISDQLALVKNLWNEFKPLLEVALHSGNISNDAVRGVVEKNIPLLKEMNKAVKLYEKI